MKQKRFSINDVIKRNRLLIKQAINSKKIKEFYVASLHNSGGQYFGPYAFLTKEAYDESRIGSRKKAIMLKIIK